MEDGYVALKSALVKKDKDTPYWHTICRRECSWSKRQYPGYLINWLAKDKGQLRPFGYRGRHEAV
jgi:hypothetical protein